MVRRRTSPRKKRTAYPALGAAPARRSGAWLILVLGALVVVNLYVFVWDKKTGVRAIKQQAEAAQATPSMAIPSQPLAPDAGTAQPTAPAPSSSASPPRAEGAPWIANREGSALEGKVGKSDTLGRLLKHSGLSAAEADEVIRALSGALDFRAIRAGQAFRIVRGADGRVQRFELEVAKGHHVRAERQPSGELIATTAP